MNLLLLAAAALVFVSILLTPISARIGAPLLLLFLGLGMLLGENGPGGIGFDHFDLAYQLGSLALAIILFSGGLDTTREEIRRAAGPALVLATLGVVLTSAIVGAAAAWLFGTPLTPRAAARRRGRLDRCRRDLPAAAAGSRPAQGAGARDHPGRIRHQRPAGDLPHDVAGGPGRSGAALTAAAVCSTFCRTC